jgi:hypothetical protein
MLVNSGVIMTELRTEFAILAAASALAVDNGTKIPVIAAKCLANPIRTGRRLSKLRLQKIRRSVLFPERCRCRF